mmetsp:Transcript_9451/g.23182  ORF Transcript_9451/g.23182 Transcript_9451/m.23182 type:complete len:227 (-) Transcript_9451:130-810(-)
MQRRVLVEERQLRQEVHELLGLVRGRALEELAEPVEEEGLLGERLPVGRSLLRVPLHHLEHPCDVFPRLMVAVVRHPRHQPLDVVVETRRRPHPLAAGGPPGAARRAGPALVRPSPAPLRTGSRGRGAVPDQLHPGGELLLVPERHPVVRVGPHARPAEGRRHHLLIQIIVIDCMLHLALLKGREALSTNGNTARLPVCDDAGFGSRVVKHAAFLRHPPFLPLRNA